MKRCSGCGETKPLDEFHRTGKRYADGTERRESRCRPCKTELVVAHQRQVGHNLRVRFGMSPTDYAAMLEAQGGVCAICGREPQARSLAVDHDHACCPGKVTCGSCVRALLCAGCNAALGALESPKRPLYDAYLRKYHRPTTVET